MEYLKPELIEMTGLESFGECTGNGSGDADTCSADGNGAAGGGGACVGDGNTPGGFCILVGNAA